MKLIILYILSMTAIATAGFVHGCEREAESPRVIRVQGETVYEGVPMQ